MKINRKYATVGLLLALLLSVYALRVLSSSPDPAKCKAQFKTEVRGLMDNPNAEDPDPSKLSECKGLNQEQLQEISREILRELISEVDFSQG